MKVESKAIRFDSHYDCLVDFPPKLRLDRRMKPSRQLSIPQRVLNRAGRPFGFLPYPLAWEPDEESHSRAETFDRILHTNTWQSRESVSGPGSEVARTRKYRRELVSFLTRHRIKSMFDAPCGDLNWMSLVLEQVELKYIGGDVSPAVLERARKRCPRLDLRQFDICTDDFADVELWHCRDTFLHLSFADIWKTLENVARSKISCVLVTSHRGRLHRNLDVATGGARPVDLERAPFNFPPPLEYLRDGSGWEFPRSVGLWQVETIRSLVAGRTAMRP